MSLEGLRPYLCYASSQTVRRSSRWWIKESSWKTENVIGTGFTLSSFRDPLNLAGCDDPCGQFNWSGQVQAQSQSGVVLWAVRRRLPVVFDDHFRASSRIGETAHPDASTALPVARERDFRMHFTIDNVPIGPNARVTLRLYALDDATRGAQVNVTGAGGATFTLSGGAMQPVNGVRFGTVDIQPNGPRTAARISVFSPTGKVWGLVTVTDNATQQVAAYWPQ